jgi:hypothetical protein
MKLYQTLATTAMVMKAVNDVSYRILGPSFSIIELDE